MPRGVYPRNKMSKHTESNEVFAPKERAIDLSMVKESGPEIEVAKEDALANVEALEKAKFMNDILDVHVHEAFDENAPKYAWCSVQGIPMWLKRGGDYKLPRKHVEVLARAKSGRVVQTRHINPDGSQTYIEKEVLNLQYPFTVVYDPNPRGPAWLREILQQQS